MSSWDKTEVDSKKENMEWDLQAIFAEIFFKGYLNQKIIKGKKCSKLLKNSS